MVLIDPNVGSHVSCATCDVSNSLAIRRQGLWIMLQYEGILQIFRRNAAPQTELEDVENFGEVERISQLSQVFPPFLKVAFLKAPLKKYT